MQILSLIVPCYNEEKCIKPFYDTLETILKREDYEYRYIFVDDGSKDNSLSEMKSLREKDNRVHYVSFSRNSGKEAAMQAGLIKAYEMNSDCAVIIDADLQHPPVLIPEMLEKRDEGYKIVYTKQRSRKKEGFFRKVWARMFYNTFNKYADVPMEQSTKDFMLLDRIALKAFIDLPDNYRFTKGILSFVGFKRYCLEFDYIEREVGNSKWNFKKLFKYGMNGLNQYSSIFRVVPCFAAILSFMVTIMAIVFRCFDILTIDTFVLLLVISILFMITNIALYFLMYVLYSTRKEVINRPLYFIEEESNNE